MKELSKFMEDVLVTVYRFVIEFLLFVIHVVTGLVTNVCHMLHVLFVDFMVPWLLDVLAMLNHVLNVLYEELLMLVCGACITACSVLIKLGKKCQELRKKHLRHQRWL